MLSNKNEGSGFRFYSFGIVIEDKTDDGDYIKVVPIEELPLAKGKLSEATFDYDVSGTDHKGVNVNSNTKGVAYVVAQWTGLESGNRSTAPNVMEGETVMLLKFASQDAVFWCDLFREPKLRRLENVIYSFSNLKDKNKESYDQDSSYWFQISTRDKIIKLHTSNNDSEPLTFDFVLDTDKGTLLISDSNSNELFWDGVNGDLRITMQNSIEGNAPMIRWNGAEYVRTTAPEITETGDDITNKASASIKYNSSGSWDADSGSTIDLHKTTVVTGDVNASGDVTAGTVSLQGHEHLYIPGSGAPTPTDPPQQ